jgi:hypothetical protein
MISELLALYLRLYHLPVGSLLLLWSLELADSVEASAIVKGLMLPFIDILYVYAMI